MLKLANSMSGQIEEAKKRIQKTRILIARSRADTARTLAALRGEYGPAIPTHMVISDSGRTRRMFGNEDVSDA